MTADRLRAAADAVERGWDDDDQLPPPSDAAAVAALLRAVADDDGVDDEWQWRIHVAALALANVILGGAQ